MPKVDTDPTARALLRAVLDHPEDDTPRLVYADWLEENGYAGRAKKIRRGVKYPDRTYDTDVWLKTVEAKVAEFSRDLRVVQTWRRGFVESVACTEWGFYYHARTLYFNHPVTHVEMRLRNEARAIPYAWDGTLSWFHGRDFMSSRGGSAPAPGSIGNLWVHASAARLPDYLAPYMPAESERPYAGTRFELRADPLVSFPERHWTWPGSASKTAMEVFQAACRKFGRVRAGIDPA